MPKREESMRDGEELTATAFSELNELVKRSVSVRERLRKRGRFSESDEVRTLLSDVGVDVQDSKDGAKWRWRTKPTIAKEETNGLVTKILKPGTGAAAKKGDRVKIKYIGALHATGKTFDSGTIDFDIGDGDVIQGWDLGIPGMLLKEKRRLKIPSHLAYGSDGAPPDIPPNATLVFDVVLKKIH